MRTVPSLVASSTVGIAAAGLALGQPERSIPPRPSSKKRKAGDLTEVVVHNQGLSSPISRPGSSSTVLTTEIQPSRLPTSLPSNYPIAQRASHTRVESPYSTGVRRQSFIRYGEFSSPSDPSEEDRRRESISSRGSWIRRLSTIPNSYNNSPRSSIGPDSPSLTFSHGSAVPIITNQISSPAQLPPNKLVKRSTSGKVVSVPISRSGSKSAVPTLRRPATSHQRSVTLQQKYRDDSAITADSAQSSPPQVQALVTPSKFGPPTPESRHAWRLYFDSRPTRLTKERTSGRSSDGGIQTHHSISKRVMPDETARPTLVKPELITNSREGTVYYFDDSFGSDDANEDEVIIVNKAIIPSIERQEEPQKRPRRSLSMNFGSPSAWISRAGSLRGNKRGTDNQSGGKRYSSAPVSTMPGRNIASAQGPTNSGRRAILDPAVFEKQPLSPIENSSPNDPFSTTFQARSRNSSSPLPPLSRLSSFNIDLVRLGLSSSSSSGPRGSPTSPVVQTNPTTTSAPSTGHVSPDSALYFISTNSKASRTSEVADRASTLIGSDNDGRGFFSGDEDEMDFQSDTVFDSLRSGATGSIRSRNPPLDSMFDESPPSLNNHSKSKRLSIHEMLNNGVFSEASNRIVEEDEGMSTPVKKARSSQEDNVLTPVRTNATESDEAFPSSPPSFSLATKDFARLSLDDEEEDEDWTRDDENIDIGNQLSPPSSSLNSRRVSPSFRSALADVTHSGSTNGNFGPQLERPKSNLFDWSEPSSQDKVDPMGNSPRPKTAHVKNVADGRGGRTIGRRGPSALHIRSQSVPVVDPDHTKLTPKFGTWGLGAKGVSEDWDGDFEFDSNDGDEADDGESKIENSGMLVPPAIQASQANIAGHVGQIREMCLLVDDLKRLYSLGKEKEILDGSSGTLWREAEGIIALALPDVEDNTLSPTHSPVSTIFDHNKPEDNFGELPPEIKESATPEAPVEVLNGQGKPTGFVYDGAAYRRRSVFSPDDDIFGAGAINTPPHRDHLRPPTVTPRQSSAKSASDVARSVMETMHQQRSTSDPILQTVADESSKGIMPFDTVTLKDLVNRASVLRGILAELVRKADGIFSPEHSPKRESSPAFTRVFTDPMASPPKHLPRNRNSNSTLNGSIDASPTRNLGQRMHMMTVV